MSKKDEQETSSAVIYHNTTTMIVKYGKASIKLNSVSIQLASGLLFNSYDVYSIYTQYQKMIKKLKCYDGLPQSLFVPLIDDKYSSLVVLYFSYINGPILFNDFFQFVVFFIYFDPLQLTPVLLSMIGVQSNIFITFDQIKTFFKCFGLTDEDYSFYLEILEQYTGGADFAANDQIPLKIFSQALDQSRFVVDKVIGLRKNLINICYNENEYFTIQNRLYYYYEIYVVPPIGHILPPKEGCIDKMKRIVRGQPAPYKYDYLKETPNYEILHQLLKSYRTKFGYSIRSLSSSSVIHFARHKSGKNQKNSVIDATATEEPSDSPAGLRRSISKHGLISTNSNTPDSSNDRSISTKIQKMSGKVYPITSVASPTHKDLNKKLSIQKETSNQS